MSYSLNPQQFPPFKVIRIPQKLIYNDLEIAKELTSTLQSYVARMDKNPNPQKRKLYECLNEMLATATCTLDKTLQRKQFEDIKDWFHENLEVVKNRVNPPIRIRFGS